MTKDELFDKVKGLLVSEFEVEESAITPSANLGDDLDLDSIDFIDLVVKMKDFVPGKIDPEIFKTVKTMQDVIDKLRDPLKIVVDPLRTGQELFVSFREVVKVRDPHLDVIDRVPDLMSQH